MSALALLAAASLAGPAQAGEQEDIIRHTMRRFEEHGEDHAEAYLARTAATPATIAKIYALMRGQEQELQEVATRRALYASLHPKPVVVKPTYGTYKAPGKFEVERENFLRYGTPVKPHAASPPKPMKWR